MCSLPREKSVTTFIDMPADGMSGTKPGDRWDRLNERLRAEFIAGADEE